MTPSFSWFELKFLDDGGKVLYTNIANILILNVDLFVGEQYNIVLQFWAATMGLV